MKFKDYVYERYTYEAYEKTMVELIDKVNYAKSYTAFKKAFDEEKKVQEHVHTMQSIGYVRYTINTTDAFYQAENAYWDHTLPKIQSLSTAFDKAVLDSEFMKDLRNDVPETYFLLAKNAQKMFSDAIIEDLQNENKLQSEYQTLIASAQIPFQEDVYTLSELGVKMEDKDRNTRKEATLAYWKWMEEHQEELDTIYDRLVRVRDVMAKKLGFENFVELGYVRMNRFDYNAQEVANYRKQVLEDVVPICTRLYDRQKKRLGYDSFPMYDEKFEFKSGNPAPKYNTDEMIKRAKTMYHALDARAGSFFDFMVDHELLDLDSKKGKAMGGYCTMFPDKKTPFIFSNFNKTSHDVQVLTHEAGHAFQMYSSMHIHPLECVFPTYESCEIHSMSMEFFTWPWMDLFFEEDTQKFYYLHLNDAVKFLPYGVLVDHFQHEIYAHPEMTPAQRHEAWRKLEKQYLPHKDYACCEVLEKGAYWLRQNHIFSMPFYYIDYTLAQVCAFQFWLRLHRKDASAFEDYYHICKIGGTKTFTQIVKEANLKVPFEDGCLKDVMNEISEYLESVEDGAL